MDPKQLAVELGEWPRDAAPMYEALAARLEDLISSGSLPRGTRLPAERRLAQALWVSRGTVIRAYELLRERSLAETRRGSGTVIAAGREPTTPAGPRHLDAFLAPAPGDGFIDLRAAAWPDGSDLPVEAFDLRGADAANLLSSSGYMPAGLPALREQIAVRLTASGLPTDAEQVLVTTGGQQAIALLFRALLSPMDTVVVEEATFPGARDALASAGARVHTVPVDEQGAVVDTLQRVIEQTHPRLVYLVSTGQNPTGTVMSEARRRSLVRAAAAWRTVVVDDEVLAHTVEPQDRPPSLASLAHDAGLCARFVTIESASKTCWGGLRVGWIRADRALVSRLVAEKTTDDLGSSVVSQVIAARLLAREDDIAAMRRRQRADRLAVLTEDLSAALPRWRWTRPRGGLSLWIQLPQGDADVFARIAQEHGVGITPGSACSPEGRYRDHVRIACTQPPERTREAVGRLADAWQAYRREPPGRRANEVIV